MIASSKGVGLTYHLSRLLIEFKRRGISVVALSSCFEQEKGIFEELEAEGVNIYKDPCMEKLGFLNIWKSASLIGKILTKEEINVVHVQGFSHLLRLLTALKFLKEEARKVRIIFTLNAYPSSRLCFLINRYVDVLIVPSNQAKELAIKKGISGHKLKVVYNWFDIKRFDEYASKVYEYPISVKKAFENVIVYLANFNPNKDHTTLLHAMADVLPRHPTITVLLLGHGPLQSYVKDLANKLHLQDNIIFGGRVPYMLVPSILSRADIGVVTSIKETFCHAVIEPMAAYKPVISTPVGVAPEVIENDVTGFLIPKRDPHKLADAILLLLENPERAKDMGSRARRIVEKNFDVEVVAAKLNNIYDGLL
jgi:glycosyltransferase involved in cell wall biosynthesis